MTAGQAKKAAKFVQGIMKKNTDRIQKAANKEVRRYESKFKVRVYSPGEEVFVNVGDLSNRMKKKKIWIQGVVVEATNGGFYRIEWREGKKKGKRTDVEVNRIKPYFRDRKQIDLQIVSETRPKKGKGKEKKVAPKCQATPVTKLAPTTTRRTVTAHKSDVKRSESHWYANENNLLQLDRSTRARRQKKQTEEDSDKE